MSTQVMTMPAVLAETPNGHPSSSKPRPFPGTLSPSSTFLGAEDIPASHLQPKCHPLEKQMSEEVNGYFLKHWPFPTEKSRQKFINAGFSTVTCWYFPEALDDRIHFACRLLTLLFLIDDQLEYMSLAEGEAYNNHLMPISRGDWLPNRSVPVEYITYDLWESMRAHDRAMADEIIEPVFTFMRAQTDKTRLREMDLREYFAYRERDVGKGLLAALMRFGMGLSHLSRADLALARPVDMNCSKHLSIVNDIWSYEKELLASQTAHAEGGVLCTGVAIFARGAEVSPAAAKRVLYMLCREWEVRHGELVEEVLARAKKEGRDTDELRKYLKGLEYQMSGNEIWSRTTLRYLAPTE